MYIDGVQVFTAKTLQGASDLPTANIQPVKVKCTLSAATQLLHSASCNVCYSIESVAIVLVCS